MSRYDTCTICLQRGHCAANCPADKARREGRIFTALLEGWSTWVS